MTTRVQILNSVEKVLYDSGEKLCFQWVRYLHENGGLDYGFRFIWKSSDNKLMPHRGQARIPSMKILKELIAEAEKEGWGDYNGDTIVKG